jgi:hypothetical protein
MRSVWRMYLEGRRWRPFSDGENHSGKVIGIEKELDTMNKE